MIIGLLMTCGEDDILTATLAHNSTLVDAVYALTCADKVDCDNLAGCWTDDELPYGGHPRDGWRQFLYEKAAADHGYDNWFLLLHGDELWTGLPEDLDAPFDGYTFPLPVFFPRVGELWDYDLDPLSQLRWHLTPGCPEFRMFKGGPRVAFDPGQHFNVVPSRIRRIGRCDAPIRHYLYRSPRNQVERAVRHRRTGFDPGNYAHITDEGSAYWTDERIREEQRHDHYRFLACA